MTTQSFWIASLESRHFDFEAFGETEAKAVDVLKQGLRTHAQQCEIPEDWFEEDHDITTREVEIGQSYRDRSPL